MNSVFLLAKWLHSPCVLWLLALLHTLLLELPSFQFLYSSLFYTYILGDDMQSLSFKCILYANNFSIYIYILNFLDSRLMYTGRDKSQFTVVST